MSTNTTHPFLRPPVPCPKGEPAPQFHEAPPLHPVRTPSVLSARTDASPPSARALSPRADATSPTPSGVPSHRASDARTSRGEYANGDAVGSGALRSEGTILGAVDGGMENGVNGVAEYEREEPRKMTRWEEKVQGDLGGWRGGNGTPRSSVPQPGQPNSTYYGQPPTGRVGKHLPKEIVRIERDWSLGDVCQFSTVFPLELETRLAPATFAKFIEALNEPLREAYSTSGAVVDNVIAILTWWTSILWRTSHFQKELLKAEDLIAQANLKTFNPVGLNVLSPRSVALQYLEIEYY